MLTKHVTADKGCETEGKQEMRERARMSECRDGIRMTSGYIDANVSFFYSLIGCVKTVSRDSFASIR